MLFHNRPLVHLITNEVTQELCVNMLLASGARAVCARDPKECGEITGQADALVLNMGTPSPERLTAMLLSGKEANRKGIPVVLDPAGVGASAFRKEIAGQLLQQVHFTAIRGNNTEIAALCGMAVPSSGVEDAGSRAGDADLMRLSKETHALIAATGKVDRIANDTQVLQVSGGTELEERITGGGCMLSAMMAAALTRQVSLSCLQELFLAYNGAAERAEDQMRRAGGFGTMSFLMHFFDEIGRSGAPLFTPSCLRLYAVTDRRWLKEGESLESAVECALRGGATMVQLREKNLPEDEIIAEAKRLLPLCHRFQVPLIINDSVKICRLSGADGVHLGQEDGSLQAARRVLGPSAILGATAHNVEEAVRAEQEGADYLGCGAAFGSATKADARPIAPGEYQRITNAVSIPVAAIGGINAGNIDQLQGLGLAGAAVISGIFSEEDIEGAAAALSEKARRM